MVPVFVVAAALAAVVALPASAQPAGYPAKPVRIVVPFGAGGVTDIFARQLAERITPALGQQVIVENRTGQGGAIGAGAVAKADPDGYTLLLAGSANAIGESLYKNLPFSMVKDFAPIARTATLVNILMVHPSLKASSVAELIAMAKERPGKLTYSSSGSGGHYHLAMEMFKSLAGVDILHVPYKTEAAGRIDLIAGRTDVMITAFGAAQSNIKQGQVKVLAVTSASRFPGLPDRPTIAEAGVPGYEGDAWIGLMAPAGTPAAIIERIHAEVGKAIRQPEFRAKLAEQGIRAMEDTPAQFAAFLKTDLEKWRKIIEASGAKVD
jgi:tripartite-type tricarboxylate transporter receptor subunit TctC